MTRRHWLRVLSSAFGGAAILRADAADDAWDVVGRMASALSRAEPADFAGWLDRAMPGYERLRTDAIALARDFAVENAIDQVSNEGAERARTIEADWLLRLTRLAAPATPVERRRRVILKLEKRGKSWKVTSLEPQDLLEPPNL